MWVQSWHELFHVYLAFPAKWRPWWALWNVCCFLPGGGGATERAVGNQCTLLPSARICFSLWCFSSPESRWNGNLSTLADRLRPHQNLFLKTVSSWGSFDWAKTEGYLCILNTVQRGLSATVLGLGHMWAAVGQQGTQERRGQCPSQLCLAWSRR